MKRGKRDMEQVVENIQVPERFDLTISELRELAKEPGLDGILYGFKYGFALGMRYQKKQGK